MRVIIAGSRDITDISLVERAVKESGFDITTVLSGAARGVDRLAIAWAVHNNIPCEEFPANWSTHGKSAGFRRNAEMSEKADALIAVWDGISNGTGHMIGTAKSKGLKVFVLKVDQ